MGTKDKKFTRTAQLTEETAAVLDRIKALRRIPITYLIEEAVINYLPQRYEYKQTEKEALS